MNFSETHAAGQTKIVFSKDARSQLFEGLNKAAQAVMCTLGPSGKTVVIQKDGEAPIVTKDGVTVSKMINLKDPIERMGAELIREAAVRTNDIAGDGTTTATVLTHALVSEGLRLLEAGYPAVDLCEGIQKASRLVIKELESSAVRVTSSEEVAQVGTISANGDKKIGEIIAVAMDKVGRDGVITVEDAKGMATTLEVVEGMQFDRGYLSPYFVNKPDRMVSAYESAVILVTDKKITTLKEIVPVLEDCVKSSKPLLIIAEDVEGEALQGLVLNRVKGNIPVVAIKAPGYGQYRADFLDDICVLTGAKLVSSSTGNKLEDASKYLGYTKKIVVDAKTTTIVGPNDARVKVEEHLTNLRERLEDVTLDAEGILKLRQRIAKLASGVAVIKVGGATEVEMIERKYRIEDALNATKAAAEEGIVPGGGMALLAAADTIDLSKLSTNQRVGYECVIKSCQAPFERIVSNAGKNAGVIKATLAKKKKLGYNAANDTYVDMIKEGVIDPVKVTRSALKHAVSVAITFLSLDAVICEDKLAITSEITATHSRRVSFKLVNLWKFSHMVA